jgi:hypothetical protein
MKFTRTQELQLIDIGLGKLLESLTQKPKLIERKPQSEWTEARRKKFSATMKKKWKEKRKANA